jgi:hypothetical protein
MGALVPKLLHFVKETPTFHNNLQPCVTKKQIFKLLSKSLPFHLLSDK